MSAGPPLGRRALLAGAALAAAGAAGGRLGLAGPGRPPLEGGLVGAGAARGHRLREPTPPAAAGPAERTRVLIVGAGVAGLAAAWQLRRAGVRDVVVLELEDAPGGNARWGVSPVTAYPWGAHYLPLPGPEAADVRTLLRELGAIERFGRDGRPVYDERHVCHAPQERLFIHGRWQEGLFPHTGASGDDLGQHEAFAAAVDGLRRWRDPAGRRAFAVPRAAGAPGALAELDRLSMADWLAGRGLRSERLRWYLEYGCRDDYGSSLAETSAWAGLHYHACRDPDPEYGEAVLTWPEGNGWLVAGLGALAGTPVHPGHVVVNVEPAGGEVAVDALPPGRERPRRWLAREVVLACPVMAAARIYAPWRRRPPGFLAGFRYAPWLVANLHVERAPDDAPGAEPAWDNVLYDSPSLGYVVATHQALRVRPGPTVLTYYRPFPGEAAGPARRELAAAPWSRWRDEILADLGRPHPGLARVLRRLDVMPYGHAMVKPVVGFVCGAALAAARGALAGPVHLAHSDLSGFSLFEEALDWGCRAGRRVARRLGARRPSPIPAPGERAG